MKNSLYSLVALLVWAAATMSAQATDYTTYLTAARGFTEVTSTDDIIDDGNYYYILTAAENHQIIVGIGRFEAKPDWSGDNAKALRYRQVDDPVADLSNFFTIEKDGDYIGFRNVVENSDLFQTHDNAGFMYVNTYSDPTLDEWSYLKPTFQDGYWLFESGKYPISSNNWACGYLGPWNKTVAAGEPMALNRRNVEGDLAGHYRLFRIAKTDLMALKRTPLYSATPSSPVDATGFIVNPSFETGDNTGWTLENRENGGGDNEFRTCEYGMSNKDGNYLMNVYTWWNDHSVSQVVEHVPSGEYELSAVLCTWTGRTATLSGQTSVGSQTATINGVNDQTGIPASVSVTVGNDQKLTIVANSTTDWWSAGQTENEDNKKLFYKVDNVRLTCKSVFLNGYALPLPNNEVTLLSPGQWYYYDVAYGTEYLLLGLLDGLVYSTDGDKTLSNISTATPSRKMTLDAGRIYFKTTRSDATLYILPFRAVSEGTFTAVALNVDGLPNKILTYNLNEDGPGESGTKKISAYLASKGYDMIGCSEDFNYNGALMESLNDSYTCGTIRKTLSVGGIFGGFPFDTDGLNLVWKNSKVSASNESWTRWNDTESTDGNQYVKKGYRHYDARIDGSAVLDVFILHMDAGDTNATWSRHSQWQQLADAVNSADATRPKLIIGDTNSRWTREDITTNFMNRLNSNLTASDVWVEFARNGIYPTTDMSDLTDGSDPTNYSNYEIVDKIIYINPKAANTLQLEPQSFKIENDYTYDYVDHDGNTKALGDHRPVVVEFKWAKSGDAVHMPVTLNDNANNTTTLSNVSDVEADVTLSSRTLYKDGAWNTLCLPFSMTAQQVAEQLAPLALMELDTEAEVDGHMTGIDGNTLYLNFKTAESIVAGRPYLIKWNNDGTTITNPLFTGVTIVGGDASSVMSTDNKVSFIGTYDPVPLEKDNKSNLFMDANNTLSWPNVDDYKVGAFRAYFKLNETVNPGRFVLNFGDESTGIIAIDNGKLIMDNDHSVYTLDGRRLNGQPTKAGVYIRNGKVIIFN